MRTRLAAVLAVALATFFLVAPANATPSRSEVIVVLNSTGRPVADVASELARAHSGQVGFVYTTALQGFTLTLPAQAIAGLASNPNVAYVEPIQEVAIAENQAIPTGIDRIDGDINPPLVPMSGVDLAILDTGVYIGSTPGGSARSHVDLNLRYVSDCTGAILYPLVSSGCTGSGDFQDRHGHGTHVAGIAGAIDNEIGSLGVAPGVTLWSFKVLRDDGTGTTGMILAGIDAVAAQANKIEVANMSLGFSGYSQAIDDALGAAKAAGVVFVVAAGNSSADASGFFPASSPFVVTVSALADFDGLPGGNGAPTCRSDVDDTLADFSNYGPLVEVSAPGVCIYSTDLNDGYSTKSGTSMASPFVAGAMARYIAETGAPTGSASDVDAIVSAVLGSAVPQSAACGFEDIDTSPEPLLSVNGPAFGGDSSCNGGAEPPVNHSPSAEFTYDCNGLDCAFTDQSGDDDGTIQSWAWDFGDGNTSTSQNPSHSYATDGTYTVSLVVTDDDGATSEISHNVTVAEAAPQLTASVPPFRMLDERTAEIPISVFDVPGGEFVGGATVEGIWTFTDRRGRTRTASVSTVSLTEPEPVTLGNAVITTRFPNGVDVTEFCLTSVVLDGYEYVGELPSCAGEYTASAFAGWSYELAARSRTDLLE